MKKLMLGNQAVAQGAYEAGIKVASAYPGTPSTEITEFIAKLPVRTLSGHPTKRSLSKRRSARRWAEEGPFAP